MKSAPLTEFDCAAKFNRGKPYLVQGRVSPPTINLVGRRGEVPLDSVSKEVEQINDHTCLPTGRLDRIRLIDVSIYQKSLLKRVIFDYLLVLWYFRLRISLNFCSIEIL